MLLGPWFINVPRWAFFLPPWGPYQAITLVPFVFLRFKDRPIQERDIRHEMIHVYHTQVFGWLGFYVSYLWEWRLGLKFLGGTPYEELAFERWAYRDEDNPKALPPDLEALVQELTQKLVGGGTS